MLGVIAIQKSTTLMKTIGTTRGSDFLELLSASFSFESARTTT